MMKIRVNAFLLHIFILHLNINLVRSTIEWKNEDPDSKVRFSNLECLLLIKVIHSESHDSTELECLFPRDKLPKAIREIPQWLKTKLDNNEISSNKDFLQLSEALVSKNEIYIPSEAASTIIKSTTDNRRLSNSEGARTVIAMKIDVNGQEPISYTSAYLSDSIFGTITDELNLVSGYAACSYGKLNFSAGTQGQDITDGVIEITVDSVANKEDRIIVEAAFDAYNWSLNDNDRPPFSHVSIKSLVKASTLLGGEDIDGAVDSVDSENDSEDIQMESGQESIPESASGVIPLSTKKMNAKFRAVL